MKYRYVPINRDKDFRRVYAKGKSFVSPSVIVYVLKNRTGTLRIGITTSKKIGNAVARNRARRVIREAFRSLEQNVKSGYDLVFVARTKTPFIKSTKMEKDLTARLKEAGILL